jgi:abortive infection bacteriophage resistance protein
MMMTKVPYPKHIQTFANQISILKQRGLMIANEQEAEEWLHKVSYYRMSGYWYPLLADRQNHIFKPGSTFEQARMLYEFDSRLRHIVLSAIERIEIAVRTQMAYVMSQAHDGYWFSDASLFTQFLSPIDSTHSPFLPESFHALSLFREIGTFAIPNGNKCGSYQ